MHIRDATPADAAAIVGLLGDLGYPATEHEAAERLARFTADPASRLLVVEADGSGVVGLVATHAVPRFDGDALSCRITDIVVAEAHRRAASARGASAAAERQARAIRAPRLREPLVHA